MVVTPLVCNALCGQQPLPDHMLSGNVKHCLYHFLPQWKIPGKKAAIALLCIISLAFFGKTIIRNLEWKNTQSLAESALKVNPGNAKVHMTMGNVLAQQVSYSLICVHSCCRQKWVGLTIAQAVEPIIPYRVMVGI